MNAPAAIVCALAVGLSWAAIALVSRRKARVRAERAQSVSRLAKRDGIDLSFDEPSSTFSGTARGRPAEYRWRPRAGAGGGVDGVEWWTEATVQAALGMLALDIRPAGVLESITGRSSLALTTGDAAFDGAFTVEGAPAAVVRELLDAETRAWLIHLAPVRVQAKDDSLHFEKRGRLGEEQDTIRSVLEGLGRLADRVPRITDAALAKPVTGSERAYRASKGVLAIESQERHRKEVEALRANWTQRDRKTIVLNVIFVTVFVVGVVALFIASLR